MSKIYAPFWDSIAPALKADIETKIPFTLNQLTSIHEIDGFKLVVKSVYTGKQIAQFESKKQNGEIPHLYIDEKTRQVGKKH